MQVADAAQYVNTLRQQRITLGMAERSGAIWDAVSAAASSVGGHVPNSFQADLLEVRWQIPWASDGARIPACRLHLEIRPTGNNTHQLHGFHHNNIASE